MDFRIGHITSSAGWCKYQKSTGSPARGCEKDNSPTTQEADDFVVTSAGSVGIGTISPTHKLDIRGKSRSETEESRLAVC